MPIPLDDTLTPEKRLIFRITHIENVTWILENGLFCRAGMNDPNFVAIGNPDLIDLRATREVPISPYGTLDDYIPFYFTPLTPMLLNIHTGWAGLTRRTNEEIVILVSSLPDLDRLGIRYVFTDRHAYLRTAMFSDDSQQVTTMVDYELLRARDFRRDPEHPEKAERYQAEALIHGHLPLAALLGIGCYTAAVKSRIDAEAERLQIRIPVRLRKEWYFS